MLKPRASFSTDDLRSSEQLSVTMVNNLPLPSYSTERFYMLSEIELKGYSTLFLCDYACDQTPETAADSDNEGEHPFSSHTILYILWKPDMASSPKALTRGIIQDSVKQLKTQTRGDCKIYLVVDSLTPPITSPHLSAAQVYQSQVETAGALARCITQSKELRDELQGLTVGISNHVRAAPGLEKGMESICWGSKDRRKLDTDATSSIGIVTHHPDDLVGLEPEPDAVQGVMQSITVAEWNGNGDLMSFAKRAHSKWCAANNVLEEEGQKPSPRPKVLPRRYRVDPGSGEGILADPITLIITVVIMAWLYVHITTTYDDGLQGFLDRVESFLTWKEVRRGAPLDDQL